MRFVFLSALLSLASVASAATLEKLSLGTLIEKSTAIVRGRVSAPTVGQRGPLLYTYYPVSVSEVLKGTGGAQLTVAVPGGSNGRIQQWASGVPDLKPGEEYVLFLWTGKSGLTQIIGLSQGLFSVTPDGSDALLSRKATSETLVDPQTRQPVSDSDLQLHLNSLRAKVRNHVQGAAAR